MYTNGCEFYIHLSMSEFPGKRSCMRDNSQATCAFLLYSQPTDTFQISFSRAVEFAFIFICFVCHGVIMSVPSVNDGYVSVVCREQNPKYNMFTINSQFMVGHPLCYVTDTLSIINACNAAPQGRRGITMPHMLRELMLWFNTATLGLSPIQQFTLRMDVS